MRLGQLLHIIDGVHQRVVVPLRDPGLEQMQEDLRILEIVLAPGVVQGVPRACHRQGRNEAELKPAVMQKIREWPVIGAGGFKSDEDRRLKGLQPLLQCDVITMTIHHAPLLSASLWRFNQHLMRCFATSIATKMTPVEDSDVGLIDRPPARVSGSLHSRGEMTDLWPRFRIYYGTDSS